jgi:hypothetical protein
MGLLPAFITLNKGGVARLDTASDMPAFSKRGVPDLKRTDITVDETFHIQAAIQMPDPQTFLLFL